MTGLCHYFCASLLIAHSRELPVKPTTGMIKQATWVCLTSRFPLNQNPLVDHQFPYFKRVIFMGYSLPFTVDFPIKTSTRGVPMFDHRCAGRSTPSSTTIPLSSRKSFRRAFPVFSSSSSRRSSKARNFSCSSFHGRRRDRNNDLGGWDWLTPQIQRIMINS